MHRDATSACNPRAFQIASRSPWKDGRQLVKEVGSARHAENPMTDEEVEHKFRTLVVPRYGQAVAKRVLAACWKLENWKA